MQNSPTSRCRRMVMLLGFAALTAWMSGCETPLRAPVCQQGEFEFPPGAAGRYRVTMMGNSAAWSGASADFKDMEFTISEDTSRYDLELSGPGATPASLPVRGGDKLLSGHLGFTTSEDPPSPDPSGIVLPLAVCRIGNTYYSQNRNDDSTFTLSRLDISPTGLTTTFLGWSPESLSQNGIGYYVFPKLESVSQNGKWSFDMLSPVRIIVANHNLDEEDRQRLLAAARATVFGLVFTRISEQESVMTRSKKTRRWTRSVRLPKRA